MIACAAALAHPQDGSWACAKLGSTRRTIYLARETFASNTSMTELALTAVSSGCQQS